MKSKGLIRACQAAAGAALALGLAAAGAQPREADCRADVARHCATLAPGEGRVAACLQERFWQLAPACQSHAQAVTKAASETRQACRDEMLMHCSRAEVGAGRGLRCLAGKPRLSAACSALLRLMQPR